VSAFDSGSSNRLPQSYGRSDLSARGGGPANLADILERVLDKGIVIAGDIQINLLDIELLTIKIRLLVASVDRAREMGINWWENDPSLTTDAQDLVDENRELRERLERLERLIGDGNGEKESGGRRK
jgi:Gas vesicle protein